MTVSPVRPGERWWLLPVGVLVIGTLLGLPFWVGDLDLRVATAIQEWDHALGGNQDDRWWWLLPYRLPGVLAVALGAGAVYAVVRGARRHEYVMLRSGIYVALVLALGCGLLVNVVLKDGWGRPRPRDVQLFGGTMTYLPPWRMGESGVGRSFPSGHVAVPAACICLWLLWRRRRPRLAWWCLGASLGLAAWVGAARMLAQGHWLSDVLWSAVLMVVVATLLHRLVFGPQRVPAD